MGERLFADCMMVEFDVELDVRRLVCLPLRLNQLSLPRCACN